MHILLVQYYQQQYHPNASKEAPALDEVQGIDNAALPLQ